MCRFVKILTKVKIRFDVDSLQRFLLPIFCKGVLTTIVFSVISNDDVYSCLQPKYIYLKMTRKVHKSVIGLIDLICLKY